MENSKCPFHGSTTTPNLGTQNKDWWPNQLNLDILRQHDKKSNPINEIDYKEAVKTLDLAAVKEDLKHVMKYFAFLSIRLCFSNVNIIYIVISCVNKNDLLLYLVVLKSFTRSLILISWIGFINVKTVICDIISELPSGKHVRKIK